MKNSSQNAKVKVLDVISKVAYHEAVKVANSTCVFWAYQPQMPKSVKNLRKF